MEHINKEYAYCIKNFYTSLPDDIARKNDLDISADQTYLLFKNGEKYEVSHEYKTSEEEASYFRYVTSEYVYGANDEKLVYERFATRENKNSPDKMWIFDDHFRMETKEKRPEDMTIDELKAEHDMLYQMYQNEPKFVKAQEYLPKLKKLEVILKERIDDISEPSDKSHLN